MRNFVENFLNEFKGLFQKRHKTRNKVFTIKEKREQLFRRIEEDLAQGDLEKAIFRLNGALRCNPLEKDLNNRLGELNFRNNDLVKAGRYWWSCLESRKRRSWRAFLTRCRLAPRLRRAVRLA